MVRLAIVGAGDLGQLIAFHAITSTEYSLIGFYDDFCKIGEEKGFGHVLGSTKDILNQFKENIFEKLIIGIGYKHLQFREELFCKLFTDIPFASVLHKSLIKPPDSKIGDGVFILPGCSIDMGVTIGNNTVLNIGCTIAHDSLIADHSFLGPRVVLSGFVEIGERCFLGVNTTVIDNVRIDNDIQTGGGCVVIENLKLPGLYVGVPARKIK